MPSIAQIVDEELSAAFAVAKARIAQRITSEVLAPAPRAKAKPRALATYRGRVKNKRLAPEDLVKQQREVLAVVRSAKAPVQAATIIEAAGMERHRVTRALSALLEVGKIRRKGTRRNATYEVR